MEFKKHKLISRFPYLATIFSLLMFLPNRVLAVDPFTRLIGDAIWSFFVYPMIWALQLELAILKLVARYNNFTNEGGVILGWIALRDLSNMFFILILLVIAFATILRISSYGYQQLLKRTLIIAILINFSKTIVGFVIDIAQIVMLTFISAVDDILTGGVVVAIGLQKFTTINILGDGMDYADYITSLVMGALLVAILLVVIGIMVMMLTMRIIALWVAIILAPLAFVASIFPATNSFYNTWIKQLGSNLVSGPMLAFFLWLTFSIVGNGEAYKSFMESGTTPGDGATEFLGTSNLVNYIVAISLLLTGIKIAASSGAAGASFAAKGMGLMQKTAGKLYRRYPKALGMRVASGVAGRVVDKDGNLRTGFKTLGKIPFYGGRLQRGAMNVKGRNAARIMEEKAEDEKYLLPQHKVVYEKTYGAGASSKFKVGKIPLGKIYSKVGSWGGDKEREAMMYQNMLARGEINVGNADKATNALRDLGDEAGMQKIQSQYWTFKDKAEAKRLIEKGGLGTVLDSVKTDNLREKVIDPKTGKVEMEKYIDPATGETKEREKIRVKESTQYALEAIANPEHGQADHNTIAKYILKWSKEDRGTLMTIVKDSFDFAKHFTGETLDSKDGYQPDKRNFIPSRLSNEAVMWAQVTGKIYPQMLGDEFGDDGKLKLFGADRYYHAAGYRDLKESYVVPGQIASRLQQQHGETNVQFKKRKQHAEALDVVKLDDASTLHQALRGRYVTKDASGKDVIDKEKFVEYRQKMYRQILNLDAYTENLQGKKRSDFHNNDHIYNNNLTIAEQAEQLARKYVAPETARGDLIIQKDNPAKEGEPDYEVRKLHRGNFATQTAYADYLDNLQRATREIEKILAIKMEDVDKDFDDKFGEGAFEREKRRMVAEVVDDKRTAHDLVSKSIWGEVQDGAPGERLAEVNTGNIHEAVMLDHALDSSENQQQAQAFKVTTPEQTQYIVDKLAELGKQPQKILLENIPKVLAAEAMQKFNDVKALQAGVLPQDLLLLGADLRKISVVLKTMANQQNMTVSQILKKDKALEGYITSLQKIHENNTNINQGMLVIDNAPPGVNSPELEKLMEEADIEGVQSAGYLVNGVVQKKVKAEVDKKTKGSSEDSDKEKT